jgi:hypothetical protein
MPDDPVARGLRLGRRDAQLGADQPVTSVDFPTLGRDDGHMAAAVRGGA